MDITAITIARSGENEIEVVASRDGLIARETIRPKSSLARPAEVVWEIGESGGVSTKLDVAVSRATERAEDALALKIKAREEIGRYFADDSE